MTFSIIMAILQLYSMSRTAPLRRVWELTADLTLFAERFLQEPLAKAYFRSRDIEQETVKHIPSLDVDAARFDLAVDGFTYRDLFVLYGSEQVVRNLLLVFQKNERDETLIPCPACRCSQIEGNSYPKRWECEAGSVVICYAQKEAYTIAVSAIYSRLFYPKRQ